MISQRASAEPGFDQLRKLTEISRALTYTTSLDQVTRLTVERGSDLLDASAAVLMLPDAEGLLQVRAAHNVRGDRLTRFSAPLGDELIVRLQGLLDVPAERFIAVPLIVGGEVTGVIAVAMRGDFRPSDEWLLSALADQAAVALENARLNGEVRLAMEDRLRASEGATTAKDRALSTLAHDIRTPLGAIDGYCAILIDEMQGPVNDRQRETLNRVRMSGRHLLGLLDNVMDMARINAGVVQIELEPVQLIDVAREACQMLIPAAEAKFQTLTVNETNRVVINADSVRLRQVLVNLIGNALKFTPHDGRVTVSTAARTYEGAEWGEVRISDNGPGIPAAELGAVFAPYYRAVNAARLPGVGLGLAISQALIQQMGGTLTVESEFGAGASFIARLPAFPPKRPTA
jgi:sigma-B regulation protein RsbU (phosphoserine phosphatase)